VVQKHSRVGGKREFRRTSKFSLFIKYFRLKLP
jgi:hypothetical protein